MNTHKILKLSSIVIFSLSLIFSISDRSYGESIILGSHKTEEDMLFTFMRDNYKFEAYAAAVGVNVTEGDDEVLANLPFRDLYHKLQKKLLNLAVIEARDAISKSDITEEMQKVMNALITEAGGGFDRAMWAFREKFKGYPNTSDLVSLTAMSIYDAKEISELANSFGEGGAEGKEVSKELLQKIFDDIISGYKIFVKNNKDALEIISRLVDEGYKYEEIVVECKPFAGRELCETEKVVKEIKKFSEIMPYVINVQEREMVKDPSVSFISNSDI